MQKIKLAAVASSALLSIGGEKGNGAPLGDQVKLVATDVTIIVIKDSGHWPIEKRPKETTEALVKFL